MTARVNQEALKLLYRHRFQITRAQFKTLRGQVLAGEDKAAMKGLWKIVRNQWPQE